MASVIVIWRFTGSRTLSETAEARAQKAVAISFFVLAPYVAIESIRDLLVRHEAGISVVGIALTATSVAVMPLLGVAKHRLGARLGSGATAGEGTQNLLCADLAAAVLAGLAASALLGWWWLDPIAGLAVAGVAVKEGVDAWRGEGCDCAAVPIVDGRDAGCADDCCADDCCADDCCADDCCAGDGRTRS